MPLIHWSASWLLAVCAFAPVEARLLRTTKVHGDDAHRPVMAAVSLRISGRSGQAREEESVVDEEIESSAADLLREGLDEITRIMNLPTRATAEQQDHLLKVLDEETTIAENRLAQIKQTSQESAQTNHSATLANIRDPKVRARMEEMHRWLDEADRQNRLGAMGYLSKLKNAMRLIKKGALQGNDKAHKSLETVMERMGATPREHVNPAASSSLPANATGAA
eukprot:TRINITY_DN35840_c0_g2_i1.p1 TRINITY_DN35840_c0_g2~~TRINITY_DN35840_c0_g2_i1.p1  ORF type:complete len:223 (+),score=48.48 TRINITY_DN35840_c0_g2_i1:80-748(+)